MERFERDLGAFLGFLGDVLEWCSNAVLIVEYWRKPVEKFLKKGDTLKGTFRFEKMSGSFKKGETLRFADYSSWQKLF
ncbi:MAG: hypothetical protein IKV32_05010 [Muribaculaceae bacterium]|nr:hypothetical protein [Muribaculaceae bacterium]